MRYSSTLPAPIATASFSSVTKNAFFDDEETRENFLALEINCDSPIECKILQKSVEKNLDLRREKTSFKKYKFHSTRTGNYQVVKVKLVPLVFKPKEKINTTWKNKKVARQFAVNQ
jgi:hypothetical protein